MDPLVVPVELSGVPAVALKVRAVIGSARARARGQSEVLSIENERAKGREGFLRANALPPPPILDRQMPVPPSRIHPLLPVPGRRRCRIGRGGLASSGAAWRSPCFSASAPLRDGAVTLRPAPLSAHTHDDPPPHTHTIPEQGFAGEFSRRVVGVVAPERAHQVPAAVDAVFATCCSSGGGGGGGGNGAAAAAAAAAAADASGRPSSPPVAALGGAASIGLLPPPASNGQPLLLGRDLRLEWVHDCK
jgi:hypothetical protein